METLYVVMYGDDWIVTNYNEKWCADICCDILNHYRVKTDSRLFTVVEMSDSEYVKRVMEGGI